MATLWKILFAPFRLAKSLFNTGLLLLILVLVAMDAEDRRPFLRESAVTICRLGEYILHRGRTQFEKPAVRANGNSESTAPTGSATGTALQLKWLNDVLRTEQQPPDRTTQPAAAPVAPVAEPSSEDSRLEHSPIVPPMVQLPGRPVRPDSTAIAPPPAFIVRPEPPAPEPSAVDDMQIPASLRGYPSDFVRELEAQIQSVPTRQRVADWNRIWNTPSNRESIRIAVKLARELPPQWWPVDGVQVSAVDLPLFLNP